MSERTRAVIAELDAFRAKKAEEPPSLFDAIASVTANAGEVWRAEAMESIRQVALRRQVFTVEDVVPLLGPTYDLRAVGGLMLEARRRGWVEKGAWVTSGRERHGRPVRAWHSWIYQPQGDTDNAA